ncbi:MAG: FG-GAP-like repeat-containing protein, partial [Rhodospirillales bacterium]
MTGVRKHAAIDGVQPDAIPPAGPSRSLADVASPPEGVGITPMTGSRLAASLLALALVGAASGSSPARWAAQGPAEGRADARELLRRGIDLAGRGRHEEAIAALRRYVRAVPDDPDGYLYLGSSLLQVALAHKRPPAEAGDVLEEGLRHDAARDDIRLKLTQVYGRRMPGTFRPDRTVELFEQLLSHHPSQGRLRLRYARWLVYGEIRLERTGAGLGASRVYQDSAWAMDKARALLREAIGLSARASNTAIEARTLLAEVQFRSGAWDAALATLKQLISGFPERHLNLASAWNTAGHCQYRKGDFKAAAESFRKAIDLKPTVAYRYDLKMAYDRLGGYPEDLPARYRFAQREEKIPKPEPLLAFEEIAARLNLNKRGGAGPCGWADYDGDGRFDLVVCGCDTFCSLYHAGAGRFDDVTKAAGLARLEPGFGAAWADYDNDGDPDLYIARNGWNGAAPNSLLQNRGNGTFVDVARQAGVADAGSASGRRAADFSLALPGRPDLWSSRPRGGPKTRTF